MPSRPPVHRPPGWKPAVDRERARKAAHARRRDDKDVQRLYKLKPWRQLRRMVLSDEPLCRRCGEKGILTPAVEVDHIEPHRGDMGLFYSRANCQPLCRPCHSAKTATEDGGFGNVRRP